MIRTYGRQFATQLATVRNKPLCQRSKQKGHERNCPWPYYLIHRTEL